VKFGNGCYKVLYNMFLNVRKSAISALGLLNNVI
jgi:hypothetical protein